MHARGTRVGDTLGVGSRRCRDRGDSGSSGECLCRQPLPRSRRRRLDPEHERVLEHLHPTRLRGERIPLAARPRRRNGLPVDRREDGLAAVHAPVRRRVRGRPLRCRPGHRERPDDQLRDPDLVDARADGGIRDVLADDARRRGLELQPDAVPGLRASADIADMDDGRRAGDRTGLRRCRRPRRPTRGRRPHDDGAALERPGNGHRHDRRRRRAATGADGRERHKIRGRFHGCELRDPDAGHRRHGGVDARGKRRRRCQAEVRPDRKKPDRDRRAQLLGLVGPLV